MSSEYEALRNSNGFVVGLVYKTRGGFFRAWHINSPCIGPFYAEADARAYALTGEGQAMPFSWVHSRQTSEVR